MPIIQVWPPSGDGGEPRRPRGPFTNALGVRVIGHPAEYATRQYHQSTGAEWAHGHVIPEDAPFDAKQGVGAHIDKWHTPPFGEEKEAHAEE